MLFHVGHHDASKGRHRLRLAGHPQVRADEVNMAQLAWIEERANVCFFAGSARLARKKRPAFAGLSQ